MDWNAFLRDLYDNGGLDVKFTVDGLKLIVNINAEQVRMLIAELARRPE